MSSWWHFFSANRSRIWTGLYIVTISFFLAKAVNLILANAFLPLQLESEPDQSRTRPEFQAKADLSRILSRNLFDSNASGRRHVPKEPEVNPDELRPSTLNAELVGTVVFENSKYSVALIRDRTNNTTKYYSTGDDLLGASLMKIERFRIIIQREGRLETLELQAAKSNVPTRSSRPGPGLAPARPTNVSFEEIGPGRFLIPENTVNDLMGNLPQIMRDARAVPNIGPDNRIDGFKMLEIKPNSIFEKLGLQNGDIVRRVNDEDLNSVEKGMSLFTALRNEKTISIDIDRSGSRLNYTYEIR